MQNLPPYEFGKYVLATRCAVLVTSSFELLMTLMGCLSNSSLFAKLVYFVLLAASTAVTAHNISLSVDGREEIKKVTKSPDSEVRGRSAALVMVPAASGVLLFLAVSGHAFFSLFVLIHVLAAVGQLGIELYELKKSGFVCCPLSGNRQADPLASPIRPPTDKQAVAPTFDPQYQTLHNVHDEIFNKK